MTKTEEQLILNTALGTPILREILIEVAEDMLNASFTNDNIAMVIQMVGTRLSYTNFAEEEMGDLNNVVAVQREKYKHEIVKRNRTTGKMEPAPDLPSV